MCEYFIRVSVNVRGKTDKAGGPGVPGYLIHAEAGSLPLAPGPFEDLRTRFKGAMM